MQTKSFKRKIQLALLGISTLASIFVFSCKTEEDSDKLTGVSIICSSTTIGPNGQLTLTADVAYNGSPKLTYEWEITSGSDYAFLSGTAGTSTVLTAANTTIKEQSVTVSVKVSDGTNSKTETKTITVGALDTIESVAISAGTTQITATGNTTLTASPALAESGTESNVTYAWSITSGSDYANLSGTTGSEVTLTGKNEDTKSSYTVTVSVTATYNEKSVTNTCNVTVAPSGAVIPTGISLSASTAELEITEDEASPTATLTATLTPANVTSGYDTVTWTSSDESVATVSDSGVVTAVAAGSATITAATKGNTYTATCTVTVKGIPTAITLSSSSLSLTIKDTDNLPTSTLKATLTPTNISTGYDTITWTSSDTSVATVSDGVVTAVSAGSATITATTKNNKTATCTVTVTESDVDIDFYVVPGASVTTYGWADVGSMAYPDTENIIYIGDDGYKVGSGSLSSYTTSQTKRVTFTNAIASGSVTSSKVGTTSAIIILSGTVDLSDGAISDTDHSYYDSFDSSTHARNHNDITYEIGSNKTIIGINTAKVAFGGLIIKAESNKPGSNIIIRNITFWDAHGSTEYDTSYKTSSKASADNLALEGKQNSAKTGYDYIPTNIWIDHCVFTDGTCSDLERNYNHDGSLDMKAGKNVTVSYCEFTNHDKVTLLAPSDNFTTPEERQITFHHNYYHGAVQRMPRSRGCQLHIYNNYYNDIGTSGNNGYALGPGIGSQYIVEGNYFGSFQNKIVQYADSSSSATTLSKFYQTNNSKTLTSSDVKFDSAEK